MSKKRSIIFLLIIFTGVFQASYLNTFVHATITGDAPPSSGSWIIENNTVVEDEVLIINSSIIIKDPANVSFINTTLLFNTTSSTEIRVNTTGIVKFENCTIRAYNRSDPLYKPYRFDVFKDVKKFILNNSIIEDSGDSFESNILIHSSAEITNCIFNRSYYGLFFYGLGNYPGRYSIIENNTFFNSTIYDIKAQNYSNLTLRNNIFYGTENYPYGGYYIINCTNVTFSNNRFDQTLLSFAHVDIINSTKIDFSENNFDGLYKGIFLTNSSSIEINDNQFSKCFYSIFTDHAEGVKIHGNKFDSVYTGIYGVNSTLLDVFNNNFNNTTHSSAQIREGSMNCTVRDNTIINSQEYGIFIYHSIQTTISNNSIEKSSHQAIFNQNSNDSIIKNNFIRDNGWEGIHAYGSNNVTIENNIVKDNLREGILLEESSFSSISSNNITSNGKNGVVLRVCNDVNVNGNVIKHNVGDGIFLYDNTLQVRIENNLIGFNEGAGVNIEKGSSATLGNNTIEINGEGLVNDKNNQDFASYLPWIIGISAALIIIVIFILLKKKRD
ncbi:MAG: right-handed parallel beta-helix repeat-containing protein [Promethearchaeota archaeon]